MRTKFTPAEILAATAITFIAVLLVLQLSSPKEYIHPQEYPQPINPIIGIDIPICTPSLDAMRKFHANGQESMRYVNVASTKAI